MVNNNSISIDTAITADMIHDLSETLAQLSTGARDRESMRIAGENMNRAREELRQRIGTVDLAVTLIRDARNQ